MVHVWRSRPASVRRDHVFRLIATGWMGTNYRATFELSKLNELLSARKFGATASRAAIPALNEEHEFAAGSSVVSHATTFGKYIANRNRLIQRRSGWPPSQQHQILWIIQLLKKRLSPP